MLIIKHVSCRYNIVISSVPFFFFFLFLTKEKSDFIDSINLFILFNSIDRF